MNSNVTVLYTEHRLYKPVYAESLCVKDMHMVLKISKIITFLCLIDYRNIGKAASTSYINVAFVKASILIVQINK